MAPKPLPDSPSFGNLPGHVFPAGAAVCFRLRVLDVFFLENAASLRVRYIRDDWRTEDGSAAVLSPGLKHYWQKLPYVLKDDILCFEVRLNGEFGHSIVISAEKPGGDPRSEEISLYSLEPDMMRFYAFKGSVHTHSTGSDGFHSPPETAAFMRRAGFDFTAVTDHHRYTPSLEAERALRPLDSGLECYPGEEVENFGSGITHILSLGAAASVSDWKNDPDSDFKSRAEARKVFFPSLPEHERTYAAQFEALTSKIHECGGFSVFCHPYWRQNSRFAATNLLADAILRRGRFDAFELGNYNVQRTALMNAKYHELIRETGFSKPPIGSSDWHGRPNQKDNIDYTVIFAGSPKYEDFSDAVRNGRCVAVGGFQDEFPFGSFRLVKYTVFLMEHFFRRYHDPLCREQGGLVLKALSGDPGVLPRIAALKQEIRDLYDAFFRTEPPRP